MQTMLAAFQNTSAHEMEFLKKHQTELSQKLIDVGHQIKSMGEEVPEIADDLPYALPDNNPEVAKLKNELFKKTINGKYSVLIKEGKMDFKNEYIFLITKGVEDCSKMIRIGDHFSTRAFKNMKFGTYRYLLGNSQAIWMICQKGIITGIYYDERDMTAFEFDFDLDEDKYYAPKTQMEAFNRVAKLITFIELGDIETVILPPGRNNGKTRNQGKVTNTSEFNVYVVDASWNKLIIRNEGFGVHGHFRLQACGPGYKDRELIWIKSFEKKGYIRRPKAAIRE